MKGDAFRSLITCTPMRDHAARAIVAVCPHSAHRCCVELTGAATRSRRPASPLSRTCLERCRIQPFKTPLACPILHRLTDVGLCLQALKASNDSMQPDHHYEDKTTVRAPSQSKNIPHESHALRCRCKRIAFLPPYAHAMLTPLEHCAAGALMDRVEAVRAAFGLSS